MKYEDVELLIDSYPGLMALSDVSGRIIAINKNFANTFHKPREELISQSGYSLLESNVSKERRKIVESCIKEIKPAHWVDYERGHWWQTVCLPIVNKENMVSNLAFFIQDVTQEKEIQQKKLYDQEDYYISLIEHSMDLISVFDGEGNVKYHSPSLKKLLGYDIKERLRHNVSETLHPEDLKKLSKQIQKYYESKGKIWSTSARIRHKDGSYRFFDITINNQLHNSFIDGFIVNARDITEKQFTENKYETLVENMNDGVYIFDTEGKFTYVNKAIEERSGFSIDDLKNKHFNDLCTDEYKEIGERNFRKILKGETVKPYIIKYRTKNDTSPYIEINAKPLYRGDSIIGVLGITRDVTEREESRIQLIKQKRYLESLMHSTYEIIFTIDKKYCINFWNKTAEQKTGMSFKQIKGKSLDELDFFENSVEIQDFMNQIYRGKPGILDDIIIRNKQGQTCFWKVYPSPIRIGQSIREVLFICRDITFKDAVHGKLVPGLSYLISDTTSDEAQNIFISLLKQKKKGFFITRTNESLSDISKNYQIKISNISAEKQPNQIQSLQDLSAQIRNFLTHSTDPVIFLDRIDYLISRYGFNKVLQKLYDINDAVKQHNAIFLLHVNRLLLSKEEYMFLSEEFNFLPSRKIDDLHLSIQEYHILDFIYQQNKKNSVVNQKHVCHMFQISKVTAQKRLENLQERGLITSKKQGRSKFLYVTEKGEEILNNEG